VTWTREARWLFCIGLALMGLSPLEGALVEISPLWALPSVLLGAYGLWLAICLARLERPADWPLKARGSRDGTLTIEEMDMGVDELIDPPPRPAEMDAVEAVLRDLGARYRWKRVVGPSGRQAWALEVTVRRGSYDVVPEEGESWQDALKNAGLT
jgi:hypothetical protein